MLEWRMLFRSRHRSPLPAMRRWLPFALIAAVALAAFGGGAILYRSYRQKVITLTKEQQEAGRRESVHFRGHPKAPVTLEEFGDFACPPCGRIAGPVHALERAYPQQLQSIFREFPLAVHPHALAAAYAAEAAGLQGKFWEMHDLLYREQRIWSEAAGADQLFSSYARLLGLDLALFEKDRKGETVRARVAADQKRAAALGVTITPSIFINGKLMTGPELSPSGLRAAVDAALAAKAAP